MTTPPPRRLSAEERKRQRYVKALLAERDEWVARVGLVGWQRELDRRRAAKVAKDRARRLSAAKVRPRRDQQLTFDIDERTAP